MYPFRLPSISAARRPLLAAALVLSGCADEVVVDDPSDVVPPRVEVEAPVTTLVEGATTRLTAMYYDDTGEAVPQTAFAWATSDSAAAADATVTGVAVGQATIRASAHGVESDALPFTVIADTTSRSGSFVPTPGHSAEGVAVLMGQANGDLQLSFQSDFRMSSGPQLFVFLSNVAGVDGASFEVAALTSPTGAQSYTIEGVALDEYAYVVVHCVPVNATFGWAQLD